MYIAKGANQIGCLAIRQLYTAPLLDDSEDKRVLSCNLKASGFPLHPFSVKIVASTLFPGMFRDVSRVAKLA